MVSQNAAFVGSVEPDPEHAHPAGLTVVRLLAEALRGHRWKVGEPDNWRDCGWSTVCRKDGGELSLVVAQASGLDRWAVQIAPSRLPGLLGRLVGRTPSAGPSEVYGLAVDVHAALSRHFTDMRWRWDGFPDELSSTPRPQPPGDPPDLQWVD